MGGNGLSNRVQSDAVRDIWQLYGGDHGTMAS